MEVGCIRSFCAVRLVVSYAAIMVIIFAFQPPVWCMLVIGCSHKHGFITAEATTGSHSNIRGSTRTLFGLYHVFQWAFLRVLMVADDVAVVRTVFPYSVADIPNQRET